MISYDFYQKRSDELETELCLLQKKYRANIEKIPKEEQLTKYKKAFRNLKNQILVTARELISIECFSMLLVKAEDVDLIAAIQACVDAHNLQFNRFLKDADSEQFLKEIRIMKEELSIIVIANGGKLAIRI